MAREKPTAADYIERHDGEMRIILGELVEYAGKINIWWTFARNQARKHQRQRSRISSMPRYISTITFAWNFPTACE